MEQIRSIKIVVEIDTNKQTHREEFDDIDKAKSFIDKILDVLYDSGGRKENKMGWWEIKNVESGALDVPKILKKLNSDLKAQSPSYTPELLLNGDDVADALGEAFEKINKLYVKNWDRPIKRQEALAAWNFVINPKFSSKGANTK
jgi:hypothetical protein